ncbi:hypothetical protein ACN20G_35020 (plasmid) [Streptomyces sp. BI20]|uniref:hypothetical protein n=1 Tax=Streptomyces sp. BI20 TaxID=3403460 RepID=UPI003C76C0DC
MTAVNKTLAAAVGTTVGAALVLGAWLTYRVVQPVGQEALYSYDVTDPGVVAHQAQNVFVGDVVAETGVRTVSDVDSRTYRVRVKESLKGPLRGEVTVTQSLDLDGPAPYRVGATYLFATNAWSDPDDGHAQLYNGPAHAVDAAAVERWKAAAD